MHWRSHDLIFLNHVVISCSHDNTLCRFSDIHKRLHVSHLYHRRYSIYSLFCLIRSKQLISFHYPLIIDHVLLITCFYKSLNKKYFFGFTIKREITFSYSRFLLPNLHIFSNRWNKKSPLIFLILCPLSYPIFSIFFL